MTLLPTDWLRVCRDIAWSEISALPSYRNRLGSRIDPFWTCEPVQNAEPMSWGADSLALDSLSRIQLATAAATWCNAYDSGFEDLFIAKHSVAEWAVVMQQARAFGARHFTFSTSGSTGVRKHIRHFEETLTAEARVWASVLSECDPHNGNAENYVSGNAVSKRIRRVLVLCPTHHIYGFIWGVLLPQALGVIAIDADLVSMPALEPGDLIVAVPDQWKWLADASRHWPLNVQGVSSTAPLPEAVHRALSGSTAPRVSRLFQIYGSTETAGLAYRTAPDKPYTLAPQRSRSEADGIALTLPDGAVVQLDVQDELQWTNDSSTDPTFHVMRRNDLSVQVGGHNVSVVWVADQLRLHQVVSQASVRLSTLAKPPRLKAFVVLKAPGEADQRQAFEQWAADTLPWYAHFSSITYGDEIPVNAIGKPCDWPETQ